MGFVRALSSAPPGLRTLLKKSIALAAGVIEVLASVTKIQDITHRRYETHGKELWYWVIVIIIRDVVP